MADKSCRVYLIDEDYFYTCFRGSLFECYNYIEENKEKVKEDYYYPEKYFLYYEEKLLAIFNIESPLWLFTADDPKEKIKELEKKINKEREKR